MIFYYFDLCPFADKTLIDTTSTRELHTSIVTEKLDGFEPINIASGEAVTIRDALALILKASDYQNAPVEYDSTKPTMIPKRIIDILNDLKKEGVTTLIAESNAGHYKGMLDKSFVIERGQIN